MNDSGLKVTVFTGKRVELPDWWARVREEDPAFRDAEPGVLVEDLRLAGEAEARKVIAETHQAGRKAVAVSYCVEQTDPPARRRFLRRGQALEKRVKAVLSAALKSLMTGKSNRVSCKKCKSALARAYVKDTVCPLCGDEIVSRRRREKLARLRLELDEIWVALETTPAEPRRAGPVHWLVGGRVKGGN